MTRYVRTLLLLACLMAALGFVVACGDDSGGDDEDSSTPTEARNTEEREEAEEEPFSFSGRIEGDFVAPDSHAFIQTFEFAGLSGTEEGVIIGDIAWYRSGNDDWVETTRDDPEVLDLIDLTSADEGFLSDQEFVEDLAALDSEEEELNGVDTRKYFIPRETVQALTDLLGDSFLGDASGLEEFEMTVWVEEESGGLVRAELEAMGGPELFDGAGFDIEPDASVKISMIVDLTDINDPSLITIEPPVAGGPVPEPSGESPLPFESFHYTVDIELSVEE